jgi:polar amino acid transport system permease protein
MQLRFDIVLQYLPFLLRGIWITFLVTIASISLGLFLGLLIAVARLSRYRVLSRLAEIYVDIVRAIPVLVILVWIFYVSPIVVGIFLSPVVSAIISLSLYASSYLAEIFRAGIRSIERGQRDAALALGMSPAQTMRRVILPQAVVRMLPPFGSMFVTLFKDSAIVSAIGVADLMQQGFTLSTSLVRPIEVLTVVGILYLILTYPQTLWVNYLHKRFLSH